MKPERRQQIESLFQRALACDPNSRASFLDEACSGDEELRREVESLLAANDDAGSFIRSPAAEMTTQMMTADQLHFVRESIGPYKIISRLGAGGMGEVFLGTDSRLGRKVAVKLLPEYFASDEARAGRFKREARAASSLNHPNVATIYEIGEADGSSYIAMEYVEGQTISAKIGSEPLASCEIVDIAMQTADALGEAHANGITHRDIKSANIMITARGQVKVLDFGLAKMRVTERQEGAGQMTTAATTEPGLVLGTIKYMSPEQAVGQEVDQRSDLFSLGVAMYEMATGRLPFGGETAIETIEQIRHSEPAAIARFNYEVSGELERIIRKCLEKDRERRYQSAKDLLIDLKNLKRDGDSTTTSERKISGKSRRYDQAIEELNKTLEMEPGFADAHWNLGLAYAFNGMHDKAVASVNKAIALAGSSAHVNSQLGQVYAVAGKKAEAQKVIDRVQAESKGRYFSPLDIAMIYSILGEKDKAFLWLEKAYDDHAPWLIELSVEPVWDNIRSDPRFRDLQRRVGLPH